MPTILAAVVLASLAGAGSPPTVAVSYFDNHTGQAELDPLGKGLADMLITDLSSMSAVQVVEREKLNQALAEIDLSRGKFIDPATAQKLGRGLAARLIMTGSYALAGDTLRIDARVVSVESGAVVASERVEGRRADFFALEKELVEILVGALQVKLGSQDRLQLRRNATQSFDAWARYSAGLDAQDRGDNRQARELFAQALAADPNYRAAQTASERLAAIFARQERETEAAADQAPGALDPRAPDFAQKVQDLLLSLDDTKSEQLRRKLVLLQWLGERNLLACTQTSGPATGNPTVMMGGVPAGGTVSHCRQAYEVLLTASHLKGDPSQWEEIGRACEYFIGQLPGDRALLRYCEQNLMAEIQSARAEGSAAAEQERKAWREWAESTPPGAWPHARLDNEQAMKAMLRCYADKAGR